MTQNKLTLSQLEQYLSRAAWILKGPVDASDFKVRMKSGDHLVLETKGLEQDKDKSKRAFLDQWCNAINQHGGFGKWKWAVSFDANDLDMILKNATEK